MDDSQWCLDECPSCATVVSGSSIYCTQCEPDFKPPSEAPELDDDTYAEYTQRTTNRVSAWTIDCYKASRSAAAAAPASAPSVFPSPCRRKLHLRKVHPTSWLSPEASSDCSPPILSSAPLSSPTAAQLLTTSSTGSPSPSSTFVGSPTRLKTHVYPFAPSDFKRRQSLPTNVLSPYSITHAPPTGVRMAPESPAWDCSCLPPFIKQKQQSQHRGRPPALAFRKTTS